MIQSEPVPSDQPHQFYTQFAPVPIGQPIVCDLIPPLTPNNSYLLEFTRIVLCSTFLKYFVVFEKRLFMGAFYSFLDISSSVAAEVMVVIKAIEVASLGERLEICLVGS